MTRPDMSVRYLLLPVSLERVARGYADGVGGRGRGGLALWRVCGRGETRDRGVQALVRPSLVPWYVSPHFLTVTAWHGGMAPLCVRACARARLDDGMVRQKRAGQEGTPAEREDG